ncbi:hypothetical protein QBC38DRAFT_461840 [Podospora fimiseda]|uniref:Transposase n=1 Tax=Podospora fimiseda TaxID=252190 RepID=A0AAN7BCV1_9PEZI|nr:hypothetical protein QBC38DRAFT_461840 [Podospora fimiseda]
MAHPLAPIYNWAKAEKHLLENCHSPTKQRFITVARNHIKLVFDKGYREHVLIHQAETMRYPAKGDWENRRTKMNSLNTN